MPSAARRSPYGSAEPLGARPTSKQRRSVSSRSASPTIAPTVDGGVSSRAPRGM
jgi:hypothetical protein